MSGTELGKKWDRCLADTAIKFGKYPQSLLLEAARKHSQIIRKLTSVLDRNSQLSLTGRDANHLAIEG